jgi:galactose mutarotase-like enzyme
MKDRHILANAYLTAAIKAEGAELCSLRDTEDEELLWQAGPAWPRHAPVLFPIVGRLQNDTLRHHGRAYRMTQHGFARDRSFAWLQRGATQCRLALHDDAETRAHYPFAFRLEIDYALTDDALEITYIIGNPGREVLPASLGAHPAFLWPLADGAAKEAHSLVFPAPEPSPIRRLKDGLVLPEPAPTPIMGDTLHLVPALFAADALILDNPASQSVRYGAPGTPTIELAWEGFRELGIWSRAGGDFLCIEPWHGMASEVGFDGEFAEKPGVMLVPPGERRALRLRIRIC